MTDIRSRLFKLNGAADGFVSELEDIADAVRFVSASIRDDVYEYSENKTDDARTLLYQAIMNFSPILTILSRELNALVPKVNALSIGLGECYDELRGNRHDP